MQLDCCRPAPPASPPQAEGGRTAFPRLAGPRPALQLSLTRKVIPGVARGWQQFQMEVSGCRSRRLGSCPRASGNTDMTPTFVASGMSLVPSRQSHSNPFPLHSDSPGGLISCIDPAETERRPLLGMKIICREKFPVPHPRHHEWIVPITCHLQADIRLTCHPKREICGRLRICSTA